MALQFHSERCQAGVCKVFYENAELPALVCVGDVFNYRTEIPLGCVPGELWLPAETLKFLPQDFPVKVEVL